MEAPGFASADRDVKEYLIYRGMYKTLLSFIEENSALQNKSGGDSGNSLESQGRGDVFGMGTSGISASEESQFDGCFLKVKWHGPYGKYAPGVSAQMISNQLWSFIRKHKFSELNSLLRTIEESLISRLEKNLSTAFIGLRCSIEKLFIVYYLRSKLPVESILRQLLLVHESENIDKDPSLLYSSHWENAWFHIPLMENPTKHERLASYFKKEWEDGLIYSVFNFFEIVFSSLTPPRLLAIANEHSRLAALKSQVLSLRLELQEKSGYSLVDEEPDEFSECIFQRSEFFSNFSKSTEQRRRLRKLSSRNTFHSDSCTSAASFSLTGNFLAAFSHDYKLSIWNLESQNGFSTTYLHPETILFETSIHCLTWDHKAEQTLFVGCSNSKIKRWNTETCMLDLEFQLGGPTYIRDILIHPNESSILVTQSSCIENKSGDICSLDIWCLEYLQKKSSFETSYVSAPYQKLGLNQDFRILAAGASDGVVHIYEMSSKKKLMSKKCSSYGVSDIRFRDSGDIICVFNDSIQILSSRKNLETVSSISMGEETRLKLFSIDPELMHAVVFDQNDNSVKMLDLESGKELANYPLPEMLPELDASILSPLDWNPRSSTLAFADTSSTYILNHKFL